MFAFFLSVSFSQREPIILTPDNLAQEKKAHKCLLVRYHSNHQDLSVRSDDDYKLVSEAFENSSRKLGVGSFDCGKYQMSCLEQNVYDLPTVRLYCGDKMNLYEGGGSYESIIKWAKGLSGAEAKQVHQLVYTPNGKSMKSIIDNHACVFSLFYTPWCASCKRFIPRLHKIARIFSDVDSIAFTETDVERYRTFLRDYNLHIFPEIRLFVRGENKPIEYEGKRKPKFVIDFINHFCGTHKKIPDSDDDFGLIDEADSVVEEFVNNQFSVSSIQKMRNIPGAGYYIDVMESIIKNGSDWISDQREKLRDSFENPSNNDKERDDIKKQINILSFFLEVIQYSRT